MNLHRFAMIYLCLRRRHIFWSLKLMNLDRFAVICLFASLKNCWVAKISKFESFRSDLFVFASWRIFWVTKFNEFRSFRIDCDFRCLFAIFVHVYV